MTDVICKILDFDDGDIVANDHIISSDERVTVHDVGEDDEDGHAIVPLGVSNKAEVEEHR